MTAFDFLRPFKGKKIARLQNPNDSMTHARLRHGILENGDLDALVHEPVEVSGKVRALFRSMLVLFLTVGLGLVTLAAEFELRTGTVGAWFGAPTFAVVLTVGIAGASLMAITIFAMHLEADAFTAGRRFATPAEKAARKKAIADEAAKIAEDARQAYERYATKGASQNVATAPKAAVVPFAKEA